MSQNFTGHYFPSINWDPAGVAAESSANGVNIIEKSKRTGKPTGLALFRGSNIFHISLLEIVQSRSTVLFNRLEDALTSLLLGLLLAYGQYS